MQHPAIRQGKLRNTTYKTAHMTHDVQVLFNKRLPDCAGWRGGSYMYFAVYHAGINLEHRPGYRLAELGFTRLSLISQRDFLEVTSTWAMPAPL